jgi:hypothetical protein
MGEEGGVSLLANLQHLVTNYFCGYIKVAEVGGKKSMHGGNKKCIQNFFRKHN